MKLGRIAMAGVAALMVFAPDARAQHEEHSSTFEGVWEVVFGSQMGQLEMVFHLEQDTHAITGVAVSEMGESAVEGVQDGEDLTFTMFVVQPDHEVNLDFTGTITGDTAEGAVSIGGGVYAWTAKRAEGPR